MMDDDLANIDSGLEALVRWVECEIPLADSGFAAGEFLRHVKGARHWVSVMQNNRRTRERNNDQWKSQH